MSAEVAKTSPGTTLQPTDQMWREMLPQLRTFVRRRIADPERAEDLVAEILLRIHRNLATLDDRERLPHWVSRIARNAVIDEYRRAGRAREQADGDRCRTPGRSWPPRRTTPMWLQEELSACLRPAAGRAAPEQAPRRRDDRPGRDAAGRAARREGVSVSGMKSRVQRGRRGLAQLLDQCCALTLDARGLPMDYTPTTRPLGFLRLRRLSAVTDAAGSAAARASQLQQVLSSSCSRPRSCAPHTEFDAPSGLTESAGLSSLTA